MRILVTGSTGYIGGRLIPSLLEAGHQVLACSRDGESAAPAWLLPRVDACAFDATDEGLVRAAVADVDAVYYLVHGMGGDDFAEVDRKAAQIMADAASAAGVQRIVYLSGIVPDVAEEELSEHISSRLEVERILNTASATVVSIRAAVILGAASTSFEIIRQISEKMPIQTVPSWMNSTVHPIAAVDVVAALVGALTVDTQTRHYDVGGPESLDYSSLLQRYAAVAELDRTQISVPLLPTGLVGALAGRLIDVPTPVVEALVESLHHDMVAHDDEFTRDLLPQGHSLMGLDDAIAASLVACPDHVDDAERGIMSLWSSDPTWAGSN